MDMSRTHFSSYLRCLQKLVPLACTMSGLYFKLLLAAAGVDTSSNRVVSGEFLDFNTSKGSCCLFGRFKQLFNTWLAQSNGLIGSEPQMNFSMQSLWIQIWCSLLQCLWHTVSEICEHVAGLKARPSSLLSSLSLPFLLRTLFVQHHPGACCFTEQTWEYKSLPHRAYNLKFKMWRCFNSITKIWQKYT